MNLRSILYDIGADKCTVTELSQLLLDHYRSSVGDKNSALALLFPGEQESYSVKLLFNKQHDLVDALAGPALDQHEIAVLHGRVTRELLAPGPQRIGNRILFAAVPVDGWFRFQDDFQVLPVPQHAPRPNQMWAEHPFLLQFRFHGSENPVIEQRRMEAHGKELELLLAGLVADHIQRDVSVRHHWVTQPVSWGLRPPSLPKAEFCQTFYSYDGYRPTQEDFAKLDGYEPLNQTPAVEFYTRVGMPSSKKLDVADNLEAAIGAFYTLSEASRERFKRAAYWLQHSHKVFRDSQSASYLALVLATESLMGPQPSGERCECCARPKGPGPTRQFKQFLSQHIPNADAFRGDLEHFYAIRSKLAHGKALLFSDRVVLDAALQGFLSSTVGSEAWNSRDLKSRPH